MVLIEPPKSFFNSFQWFPYIDADPPSKARDRIDSIL